LIDFVQGTTVGGTYFTIDSNHLLYYNGAVTYSQQTGAIQFLYQSDPIPTGFTVILCEFESTNGDLVCSWGGGTTFWLENVDANEDVNYPDVKATLGIAPNVPDFPSIIEQEVVYVKALC
jgi:hypothetical protein